MTKVSHKNIPITGNVANELMQQVNKKKEIKNSAKWDL